MRCQKSIPNFWAAKVPIVTACGRPSGHDGGCWPVELAIDKKGRSDDGLTES